MDSNSRRTSSKNTKACPNSQQVEDKIRLEDNRKIEEVFPWLPKFNKAICSCTGSRNYQHLEELLLLYTQNILSSIAGSNVKFNDEINLKNHINKMLIFFHLYWLDIKQDIADHSQYLNKITALLNVYIDMELKTSLKKRTSSHVKDSSEIVAKILATLYIYLNNSEEHISRVLHRIKHTTEKYTKVCNHIFTKSFSNLKIKTTFITELDNSISLQCIKKIHTNQNCSKSQKDQTNSLFHQSNSNGDTSEQKIKKCLDGSRNNITLPNNENKFLDQTYLQKKRSKSLKPLKKIRKKPGKPIITDLIGEPIIIDLTGDDEIPCKVKRKRTKRNSECLRVMKNIIRRKKHINPLKYSDKLVNADVKESSNENNKNLEEKVRLECEALTSREESAMETIPLFKTCQNNIADQHSFKQELPTSTNCSVNQTSHKCCNTMPDVHDIIKKLKSINDNSSQITKIIQQKVCNQVNDCPNCCIQICKPFISTNNDISVTKAQGTLYDTFNDNENDIKLTCDTNIIYTRDRNKCVYVVNHIDERVMTVNAEKRVQCLDKSNDTCTVSTTFTEDQIVEPPLYNQHVNFDHARMNDYDNAAKYSEATIKEQQKITDCDSSVLNNRLHSSKSCTFDINSFDICSNVEVDLKSFPKIEESDEITKTDYVDDLEHINFLNNIQSETLPEDFFRQSFEQPQISYDNLTGVPTKKSLMYTDNDVTTVKTQDTLHSIFNTDENDVKIPYDRNIIYMLSDRDKCIYITNHTGEHIMTTSAEKRMQCLHKSNDICTVSTTFTGDQIVESSLDSQHVNSDNRRKRGYKDTPIYSEDAMKEQQGRNNCDTSMSDEQLHSSELCTFDIDSFKIDSKETSEIMKTDLNDFENISFLHNIQTETLEDILSNDTTNFFLPLKQSLFELDNVYTETSLNEKNVLCNNQNDAIDSSIDLVASHLNTDNTFLRLPAKFDKSVPVKRFKKPWNFDTLPDKLNNDALTKCFYVCKKEAVEGFHILEDRLNQSSNEFYISEGISSNLLTNYSISQRILPQFHIT